MFTRTVVASLSALLLAGCASPVAPAALSRNHPASPDAAEALLPAVALTLDSAAQPIASGDNEPPPLTTRPGENAALSAPRMTPATFPATRQASARYTCPMHPDVVSDKPGECPKCGMDLVPATVPSPHHHGGHS
jgi:hypothetical protein